MRWLLDEMLPPRTAAALEQLGHDARAVRGVDLAGRADRDVLDWAVRELRIVVTENVADYAALIDERLRRGEPCVPVVFVRRSDFPARGAFSEYLARVLVRWAGDNPDPYLGAHWPTVRVVRRQR